RGLFFAVLFLSLWTWFVPRWIGLHGHWTTALKHPLRWLGVVPLAAGAVIMLWCVFGFALRGRGTPAPFDAPRRLVVVGPYRYVRNPMYWGLGLALAGEAVLFADLTPALAIYGGALALAVVAFVLLYEEPALRRQFGAEYEQYCAA